MEELLQTRLVSLNFDYCPLPATSCSSSLTGPACVQGKIAPHRQGQVEQRRVRALGIIRAGFPPAREGVLEPQPRQRTPVELPVAWWVG